MTNTDKPVFIEIENERLYPVHTWEKVYLWGLNTLQRIAPIQFNEAISKLPTSTYTHEREMLDCGVAVETGYTENEMMRNLLMVAKRCGIRSEQIRIGHELIYIDDSVFFEPEPPVIEHPEAPIPQKASPYVQAAESIVLKADLDGISIEELSDKMNTSMVATKQIVADSKRIVAFGDKLIHEESFVDWEEGANQLEEILDKLLNKNNGYVSSTQLYSFAHTSMHMFLNDNDMDDERAVYEMAQHLFEKVGYHEKHLTFWMKSHISRGGEEAIHSNLDIIKKFAQDHGGFFEEEELEEYLKKVGVKSGNLHGQMRLREEPIFFYYDEDTFMTCESMKIKAEWFETASEVLKRFFAEMGDHVVLRDIETHWYMQMPSLPGNRVWTPLLLQSVLRFYGNKLNARTICGMSTQGLNTVHAMIVHADSEVQSFCDAVAAYIVDEVPERRRFEAEDLRQLLVQRGMIAGNELIGKLSKALANDERFAWDAAGKHVTVKV